MTNIQNPTQTAMLWTDRDPEGINAGPPGFVVVNQVNGKWWRKTTRIELTTGWVEMGSGTPSTSLQFYIVSGDPEGFQIGSPGDTAWDPTTNFEYRKVTGVATNTGWRQH